MSLEYNNGRTPGKTALTRQPGADALPVYHVQTLKFYHEREGRCNKLSFEYQMNAAREKKREWWRDHPDYSRKYEAEHREQRTQYRARYRAEHPEETKAQRLKDWKAFVQRNPERWKEIEKAKQTRRKAQREAILRAEREANNE